MLAKLATLLACIWEVHGLNLIRTQTILTEVFHDFSQSLQANVGVLPQTRS
jgi:hypothetical protein